MEMQGWSSVAAASKVLRQQRGTKTKQPIAETVPPRVAVLVSPSAGEVGAMEMDQVTGALHFPSGSNGVSRSRGFQFDYLAQPSDAARMFEERVAPVVDMFVDDKRSGSIVMIGGESARVREALGNVGASDTAGMDGVLPKVLMRLVVPKHAAEVAWDLLVMVHKPEAVGTMVDSHSAAATQLGTPRGSPTASPRLRPVTMRLAKPRDVATACTVVSRQLAALWGDAEAAVGGQLICTIRRKVAGRDVPGSPRSLSDGAAVTYKHSTTASMDGGPQLSVVVFGAVESPNHISFRALTRLLKLRLNHEKPPQSKEAEERAYALAVNTVHVRGIPMDFSEAALQERFSQFGYVLTAVIRIRPPDAEHEHNSWALIAFADADSVNRLLGSETVAYVEGDGMAFTARRINPKLAISSDGSFGQIFQTCRDRVAQARAIALACADSKVTYHLRESLVPGSSFLLVAAVSASATTAASTLTTLQAAKEVDNTGKTFDKTGKLSKLSHHEMTTQALKLTTGRLQRHLVQHTFSVWTQQLNNHRRSNHVLERFGKLVARRRQQRAFVCWADFVIFSRRKAKFLVRWRRQYCRYCFDHWLHSLKLTMKQRTQIRRVHGVMSHRQTFAAFTRWVLFSAELKWAKQVSEQVLRRLKSQLVARAFSSWLAWLRSVRKAISQVKAVVMRMFQRLLSAAFNAWAAEHRAIKRRAAIMAVCVCRLQRFSTARAFQQWYDFRKELQRSRRILEHVLYRLRSLASARAFAVWARTAAAKKEALLKSTVERMLRLNTSKSVRYCWSQWCRYLRRTLAETASQLQTALTADAQRIEEARKEDNQNVRRMMAAQRKAASELCLRQRWRNRVALSFSLWIRWQTRRRQEYASQRYQETKAALEHCEATTKLQGFDAANLQHEISAMLALHEHTCKARIDARQISEAAVDRQVELDLAVVRQRYETELAELTQTNQRLRKALLSSLAEATEYREKHSDDRATNMQLREQLLAAQARLSDILMPRG